MITSALLLLVFGLLYAITSPLRLLDDVQSITAISDAIDYMSTLTASLAIVVPVATIVQIIVVDIIFEAAVFFYKGVRWIYQKIPFIN